MLDELIDWLIVLIPFRVFLVLLAMLLAGIAILYFVMR
jgi:hypothetical protein